MTYLSDYDIFRLSENMTHSKKDFLAFISYYHGENSDEYHEANRLILTRKDILQWIDLWDGNIDEVHNANRFFRQQKTIENLTGGYDEFKDLLYLDKDDFLATYFQQEVSHRNLDELDRILSEMSILELSYLHFANPTTRIECLY